MAIDSTFLNASSAYTKLNNLSSVSTSQASDAISSPAFNQVLAQTINNPSNLAALANNGNAISSVASNSGLMKLASDAFNKAREKMRKSEYISNQALLKKASLTDVVTAISEAEVALQSVISIRDKVIAAYQDIIKMQI